MSLKPQSIPPIPELTAKVALAAFRKGNVYMQMRDLLGTFFTDDQFVDLYPADGQPAYALSRPLRRRLPAPRKWETLLNTRFTQRPPIHATMLAKRGFLAETGSPIANSQ